MPGLRVFGRRWGVASDDLVFPGIAEIAARLVLWIIIAVFYGRYKLDLMLCTSGALVRHFFFGLLLIVAAIILILSTVVYTSMKGTISNPHPRRRMPLLIYLRTVLYVPEFTWLLLGLSWVFEVQRKPDCAENTVGAMQASLALSCLILIATLIFLALAFDPLGSSSSEAVAAAQGLPYNLEGSETEQLFQGARQAATRVWATRVRLLCCCVASEDAAGAFDHVAGVMRDFFMDTDLVASDIAAGLSLLHQYHDNEELQAVSTNVSTPSGMQDLEPQLLNAKYYVKFASAAYGWPIYILQHPISGLRLFCRHSSCRRTTREYELVGSETQWGRHTEAILGVTGLQPRDLLFVSFQNAIYQIPFFVALDHRKKSLIVAIRGTLSLRDLLTDLSAECEKLQVENVEGDCYAHKGMVQAAGYIFHKLVKEGILNDAFQIAADYNLVITGHSLGAGVAALLATLLHPLYPNLCCYAFAPPSGLVSRSLAEYGNRFIVSLVVGKDLVPRLSLSSMEDLKQKIVEIIARSSRPKYQILFRGFCYEIFGSCGVEYDESPIHHSSLLQPLLAHQDSSEDQPLVCTTWGALAGGNVTRWQSQTGPSFGEPPSAIESSLITQRPALFPPGKILYLSVAEEKKTWRSECRYQASWEDAMAFQNIRISPRMFTDHTLHTLVFALEQLCQAAHGEPVQDASPDDPL
uniref:Diacylglycerol lipase-beta n=1 Tax=Eptatretus burgeri TaxID=7764 RepID=A0A8C4QIP8_EPTBU